MTTKLYLVQHGEARSELEDPERSLTGRGEEETRKISDAAKRLSICPAKIYHSGKKRAEQTAGIMRAALDLPAQRDQGLNPNDAIRPWVERISAEAEDLMIVGHLPFLAYLASLLTAGRQTADVVSFDASSIACLNRRDPGQWRIEWMITPKFLV